ncbi:MAG: hypothetical protein ACRDSL_04865 [Pseudonocardiaceae bacterium]
MTVDWRAARLRLRSMGHRVDTALHSSGAPTRATAPPLPAENYVGWRVRWLGTSMWCRTPGDEPDIEISRGTEGTVTEYVREGSPGSHGYWITFDNGAVFGTYLPAPWALQLTPGDDSPRA